MSAIIQINSGTPGDSNDNLGLGAVVTLTSVDTALHSYTWAIVSQPAGPNDIIVGSGQIVTFTPTKEGSYLVKLTVDFGYPSEDSQQLIAAVRELETGDRIPAIGETVENSVNDGWANPVDAILERVTRYTDAGVLPGVAGEALAIGDIVYPSSVYTLAAGLPGQRLVALWAKAHANIAAEVQGVYGVVIGSVLGGSIVFDNVISVQTTGLYQGVPFVSAPSVGDPVFVSNAAGLSLTAGTLTRQIGTVCFVGASTYDVMVGPAPAEIDAPAGGDLSGTFPDPTVVGLQGRPIAATAPSSGEVLGWSGTAWAPTSNSAPPTGSAGGVLGYTSSTYPNPSGLAPVSGSTIPVGPGIGGGFSQFVADNSSGATQSPGLRLVAGSNTGVGQGGDAMLIGGESTTGDSAYVSASGATSTVGGAVAIVAGLGPVGGAVVITAGQGDITDGGAMTLTAGVGAVDGGVATLVGGASSTTGGPSSVQGGEGGAGAGGAAGVLGGNSSGGGNGGAALIDAGTGATNGNVLVGTIRAEHVSVGRSGKDVLTNGRNVGVPTTYAPVAATTIPVNGPTIFLNPAANRDMTASPTLQTSGITAGTIVTLVNEDSTFYVDLTQDAGGTSYLKLSTGNIYLYKYDTITFIFDGTYWVEVGRNVQPGKSYTPVAGTTIPVLCPVILLANAGNVDLGTANATIQTTGINAGTRVTFVQKAAGTTTFRRGGSTLLRLSNASHAVAQYGTLELVYDGTNWCEVALANNA